MISCSKLSYIEGILLFIFSGMMVVPLIIDLTSGDAYGAFSFVLGMVCCIFIGGLMFFASFKPNDLQLDFREKTVFIVINWLGLPILSALPLLNSTLEISAVDVLFEMVSAITTSGATVISDVQVLSPGMFFWRSFVQLIGSISFVISNLCIFEELSALIMPSFSVKNNQVALFSIIKIVVSIYCGVSFVSSLILIGSGISPMEAFCSTFSAISSGGITFQREYLFENISLNLVMIFLMFFSGISVVFFGKLIEAENVSFRDIQLKWYVSIIVLAVLFVLYSSGSISIKSGLEHCFEELQIALFNVISAITTTCIYPLNNSHGGSSFPYLLSFCGGCFGSCTGGVKILRLIIIFSLVRSYLSRIITPNAVYISTYDDQKIEEEHLSGLFSYLGCYIGMALLFSGCLTCSDFDFTKSFGAVITSMNNNGPYLGLLKGTPEELAILTSTGKITLMLAMIAGRLEFVPFFIVLVKSFWKKGK